MSILGWIFFGALVGWIATGLTGVKSGCLMNIALGIVGAVVGGFLFSLLLLPPRMIFGFDLWSLFVAVVGAMLVIVLVRGLKRM